MNNTEWITDRKPIINELIEDKDNRLYYGNFIISISGRTTIACFIIDAQHIKGCWSVKDVEAWMPFPKPYKKEEDR